MIRMKCFRTGVITVILVLLSGCSTYNQAVQLDDRAYLLLIGYPGGNIVTIDNGEPINLSEDTQSYILNGQEATKIEIPVGQHEVKIINNGNVTVKRSFYVSSGNSFEVKF